MIEVILREDIKTLGKAGEMVRVKPGYARNFLLPHGLAYEATEGNKKRIAAESRARTTRNDAERAEAEGFAATLGNVTLTLAGKAGEEGKLFGSITAQDIADALARLGHGVDKRRIELDHPIKTLGTHDVEVRLHRDVTAHLQVEVVPLGVEKLEEAPAAAPAATE
jgi:large subunit ribosomal protein L9